VIPAFFMFCIALWAGLLYAFMSPWAALAWLLVCIGCGPIPHKELQPLEIEEMEPLDPIDLETELNCRGGVPHDRYYEKRAA
jgi:hypothetical protein